MQPSRSPVEDPLSFYDYELPPDRIALHPSDKRENAKLLIVDTGRNVVMHSAVSEIAPLLRPGDLLVFNRAKVRPARVTWKKPTGGKQELLLLRCMKDESDSSLWEALLSGRALSENTVLSLPLEMNATFLGRGEGGIATVQMTGSAAQVDNWLQKAGRPPLPPYIRKGRIRLGETEDSAEDPERYQTAFATAPGAVAAPTAGLHFSRKLIAEIESRGVQIAEVNLSVGWGTFQEISARQFEEKKLHSEWVEVSSDAVTKINEARAKGGRIIAVGTTTVRALEWWHDQGEPSSGAKGWCDLFLFPPWKPRVAKSLITNFHLPRSSLLCLVAGYLKGDTNRLMSLYQTAIEKGYRFYSYGDAMWVSGS